MYRIFLCFSLLISYILGGQTVLTPQQLKEDFSLFENILKQGHPSLYEYSKKNDLDSLFASGKELFEEEKTDLDLYRTMITITDQIKDGNLRLVAPDHFNIYQNYFPLIIKIIHSELYTDTNYFDIPAGSKILLINGIKTSRVLNTLLKYTSADGYNLTRKYRNTESNFGLYYAYEYGINKKYLITLETPDKEHLTVTIPAEPFAMVKQRSTKRNSYFSKFHSRENDNTFFSERVHTKTPFIFFEEELNTAVLTINSFGIDIASFKNKLISIFNEIHKKKIKYLVIDIRQNNEGLRANAIHLFSYLSKSPFKQRISTYISSDTIPQSKFVISTYLNEREHLTEKFENHVTVDGWELKFDDLETIMIPFKERFQGKIYVLTSGKTFSAGAVFAQLAKNDPNILLIGEETGGGYYTTTSDFPVLYELPHSKTKLAISMVKIKNFVKDKTIPKGTGVLPDRTIYLKPEDLINGKDPCLDYLFRLIHGQ